MADTPFGLTFGNPSKYMGSSGIGPAIKAGLTAYGMQKSGLTDFLNNLNKKPDEQSVIPGAVPLPSSFNKYLSPMQPGAAASAQEPPNPNNANQPMMPAMGGIAGAVAPESNVVVTPIPDSFSPDIGHKILDGNDDWQHSAVNPQAERDSLVLSQQVGYNMPLQTGNEYQQVPGYGSAKKAAMAMFGMG